MPKERLQKVIAAAGLGSRRQAELWIQDGQVTVNGVCVTRLGTQVDPESDRIEVHGRPLNQHVTKKYLLFHKPKNVMVTQKDPQGRPTIYDYVKDRTLKYVGRLDFDSEGLILMTNDGELIHRWTHPSHEIPKTYHVKVKGRVNPTTLAKFQKGLVLEDGPVRPRGVKWLKNNPDTTWLEIVLIEGRNRIVRRFCAALGYPVLRLIRVGIGSLVLGNLPKGKTRALKATAYSSLGAKS